MYSSIDGADASTKAGHILFFKIFFIRHVIQIPLNFQMVISHVLGYRRASNQGVKAYIYLPKHSYSSNIIPIFIKFIYLNIF